VVSEARGLSDADLAAIADLEQRVIAHDGGRLKLEWPALRERSGERVDDLLWRDGDQVLGFLGLYSFGSADLELAGMVDPAARRRGIGTALLEAAKPLARARGFTQALLVTPRSTSTGRAFADAVGAALEHSEHHLALGTTPTAGPLDPTMSLREATPEDRDDVVRILSAAFGEDRSDVQIADRPEERTLVAERGGAIVGTVRLTRDADRAGIYGLAVTPSLQGKGIGRDVLIRVCRQLRAAGAERVTLEVAADNDRALGLYRSAGFEPQATEDYFAVTL